MTASDGQQTAEKSFTYTRNQTSLSITLTEPFKADALIAGCQLKVKGSIHADAVLLYEVTNNALDDAPVWEDCTDRTKGGFSYAFKNKTAEKGFAFNFRVSISRGASGAGGYITSIEGGYE